MKPNKKITDKKLIAKKLEAKQMALDIVEGVVVITSGVIVSACAVHYVMKWLGLDKKETSVTIPSEDIEEEEVTEEE